MANKEPVDPFFTKNLSVLVANPSTCNLGLTINDQSCPNNNILEVDIDVNNAPGITLGTDVFLKELRVVLAHDWTADLDFFFGCTQRDTSRNFDRQRQCRRLIMVFQMVFAIL